MADDDWKKRVGIEINFSSDSSEDDGGVTRRNKDDKDDFKDQLSPKIADSNECSLDGTHLMDDYILNEYGDYGTTPPRTRISRRQKERRQREKQEQGTETKNVPKVIHAKTKRRNTLDSIYFEFLEKSENGQSPQKDTEQTSRPEATKRNSKRSMKLLRGSERDMKLDHTSVRHSMPPTLEHDDDRAESMPVIVPQPAIKVETCNRFLSLTSKLVACRHLMRCDKPEQPPPPDECFAQSRVDFFNTFSLLIRIGNCDKQTDRNPRRQLSKEEHLWQNELKDLIWLELQAWHADRTPTEQDEYLCNAREKVGALLEEIMKYRFVPRASRLVTPDSTSGLITSQVRNNGGSGNGNQHHHTVSISTQSSDSGVGSDGSNVRVKLGPQTIIAPGTMSTQSSDSGVSSDGRNNCEKHGYQTGRSVSASSDCGGEGSEQRPCSGGDQVNVCPGCLSIYCHNCMENQIAALKDVERLLNRLEAAEALYPSSKAFALHHPVYKSSQFVGRVKAMCLWYNMTKHHRLKVLILGKLLMFLQGKNCNWPPIGDDDPNTSSGIGTDTSASDDASYQDFSHLSRSSSIEKKTLTKHKRQAVQFEMDSSSPSDSNNSNASSHGTAHSSDAGIGVAERLVDYFDSRTNFETLNQSICHNMKPPMYHPYRAYIEEVLKTRGLRKAVHFLEKLHRIILVKSMISLGKPVDSSFSTRENSETEKDLYSAETLPGVPQSVSVEQSEDEDEEELRRYGYWSEDAQALGLPSYRSAYLFLSRIPLDVIHEFMRMRLEQKPEQPSVLCIRQLMRELKEGLRIAVLHRERYLNLVRSALWDVDVSTLQKFEDGVLEYDISVKNVLQLYLEYLQQWVPMVQQERFQKNLLEEEWLFVKITCAAIQGGEGIVGSSFCHIATGMLESIGQHLSSRVQELTKQLHDGDLSDDESSTKQAVMSVFREFQTLFNETRERAVKAVSFAKTIRKDLEEGDFVQQSNPMCCEVIAQALKELKTESLALRKDITSMIRAVEDLCDQWDVAELEDLDYLDRTALLMRCREVLHLGYKFGFEYHKELYRVVTGDARPKLSQGLLRFAHLWMNFVMKRCERGRGLRPRWANQGLDFLMTVCEPQNTCHFSDEEFEDLKSSIDKCISHVIGTKPSAQEKGPSAYYSHTPRGSLDGQFPRSRGSSPSSRTKSPTYRTSRSLQDGGSPQIVTATQRSLSAHTSQPVEETDAGENHVDGFIAETLQVPLRALALTRIERVQSAVAQLESKMEDELRSAELIGSVTDVESEDKIHIKSRSVTFSWQRGIKIGQGRFGKVYTAVNNKTGELLAMKEIQLQPNDHRTIRRVAEELRTFEGINHRTLVRYYGVEIHREEMLIFMEFCAEGTLESLVAATECGLPETLIRRYTHQLLEAVATLHNHGVVHRDIKSANIFLTDEGNSLKLGDFGSAVKIKAHTTMAGELQGFVGTQAYMAPEVFMKTNTEGHGRAADIWSVGCVVVEMSSGKRPWAEYDSNYQIMFKVGMGETPAAPASLSEEGHHFLGLCLQHDPRQRAGAKDLVLHTFVKVDGDEEYLSTTLPSIFEDYFKLRPKR